MSTRGRIAADKLISGGSGSSGAVLSSNSKRFPARKKHASNGNSCMSVFIPA